MNDGGPAFPNITPDMPVNGCSGMTLRDYFAGRALTGLLASPKPLKNSGGNITIAQDELAEMAYVCADAMLKEKAKP